MVLVTFHSKSRSKYGGAQSEVGLRVPVATDNEKENRNSPTYKTMEETFWPVKYFDPSSCVFADEIRRYWLAGRDIIGMKVIRIANIWYNL